MGAGAPAPLPICCPWSLSMSPPNFLVMDEEGARENEGKEGKEKMEEGEEDQHPLL